MKCVIKYTELFYSFQGEGRYVGVPSIFLRTFGCNFECRGFGQQRDNLIPKEKMPHNLFPIEYINSVQELPIFDVGCDSSASWSKRYKHLAPVADVKDIAKKINDLIPQTDLEKPHLVITGGEPLLGWQRSYPELLSDENIVNNISHITFETNGTKRLNQEFINYLNCEYETLQQSSHIEEITWSVSPKLSISGEPFCKAMNPKALLSMNEVERSEIYLKFVVRNKECLSEVETFIAAYKSWGVKIKKVYLMPEGATMKGLSLTENEVAKMCLEYGYNYSPRLHVNVFGNKWGT